MSRRSTAQAHTTRQERQDADDAKTVAKLEAVDYHVDSLLWVAAGSLAWYWADLHTVLMASPPLVSWTWIAIGVLAWCAALSITVFLEWSVKVPQDKWDTAYPYATPTATVLMIVSAVTTVVGLWGAYGYTSPIVFFFIAMAAVTILGYL